MELELRHFRVLAAIVDAGGVTPAARRLHLTQSALSYQLRDAEEKLGTALFLRLGKKMVLTPAGDELLASARRILADVSRTEERVRGFGTGVAGTLRLSTECYTCYHWLPPVMEAFHRSFPGVEVRIELDATRRPVPALLEGKLDVAIVSSDPDDPRLALRPIFGDEMVVLMSRRHRLGRRPFLRPADLAEVRAHAPEGGPQPGAARQANAGLDAAVADLELALRLEARGRVSARPVVAGERPVRGTGRDHQVAAPVRGRVGEVVGVVLQLAVAPSRDAAGAAVADLV